MYDKYTLDNNAVVSFSILNYNHRKECIYLSKTLYTGGV